MSEAVTIRVGDVDLAGDLHLPGGAGPARRPGIVMSQGFGAVKDMSVQPMAEAFARAGFATLLYDHRNFGESGGEPRQEVDPWEQVRDMREVISYLRNRPEVDPDRIGLWGTSFSGGHALVIGAIDRRVKCVVSQVPMVSGSLTIKKTIPSAQMGEFLAELHADYDARGRGEPPRRRAISQEGSEGNLWARAAGEGTKYKNECTVRSLGNFFSYEPGDYASRITPTPVLFVVARNDSRCPVEDQLATYSRAHEPKKLVLLDGGHFDPYLGQLENATAAARDWFLEHL